MYLHKHPYPTNFAFVESYKAGTARLGRQKLAVQLEAFEGDLFRISVREPALWPQNYSQAELQPPPPRRAAAGGATLRLDAGFGLTLRGADGTVLLRAPAGHSFGLCGKSSLFLFERDPECQFYGMGEKQRGLELSNVRTKFWNTDVWADFAPDVFINGQPDPMYVSIPYLIVKRGNQYVGLLLDNPQATFMCTAATTTIAGQMAVKGEQPKSCFWLGCEDGLPELYLIVGPTLAELTRKLQCLVGKTPLPPAWALGYHQCRWGYESLADMEFLDANFQRSQIPCDGFWFDIEYMDGYRVFTWDESKFPQQRQAFADLRRRGRRIVPILDPGVKFEKGYPVYDDGHQQGVFCRNPQGGEYIGLVWPGETVFPDFSTAAGCSWWAGWVKKFAETGVAGAWLDMNDPATGHVDNQQMLFHDGQEPHATFHNQYALGMARASRQGFLLARPDTRPFFLCRSGCTGSSKYTAIWTGDNYSNWHHLRGSIAMTLNLALSGIPFNGPDVGGFGGDVNQSLMVNWIKAACLFPVLRNHSIRGSVHQEPWVFDNDALAVIRDFIRLRYQFRPYLYNLFVAQEERGEAILRPLFYDFADSAALPLGTVDDQFMCGPALMHAPLVGPEGQRRVVLPDARWYSFQEARWLDGGRVLDAVQVPWAQSPLFARAGSIVPLAAGEIGADNTFRPREVEFHLFLDASGVAAAATEYVFDDGESHAYQRGARSRLAVTATRTDHGTLAITTELREDGYGACQASFVLYASFKKVTLNGRVVKPKPAERRLVGVAHAVQRVAG